MNRYLTISCLIVILCFCGSCDGVRTFKMIGHVKEKGSLKPIEGAILLLCPPEGSSRPALRRVSGPDGSFKFPWESRVMRRRGGPPWSLKVEKKGYKPQVVKIYTDRHYGRNPILVLLEPEEQGMRKNEQ